MQRDVNHPVVHRWAVATVCVALLPICAGALVTTLGAGMAFTDWPGSDGHNMMAYPFWQATRDKFIEHSHRLAAVLVGISTIVTAGVVWRRESRAWVRWLAIGLLLGVVGQGVLGGQRVLLESRGLAFVHGSFAALLFGLMGAVAVVTSDGWRLADRLAISHSLKGLLCWAGGTVLAVYLQYSLGGLVRHQGSHLYLHLGWAFAVAMFVLGLALGCLAANLPWVKAPAALLAFLILGQLMLGAATWVTKYGMGDQVVKEGSPVQVTIRTLHTLTGMAIVLATVVVTLRLLRLEWCRRMRLKGSRSETAASFPLPAGQASVGGAR